MLHQFLSDNRAALIDRCRIKMARRPTPITVNKTAFGLPVFIDQLIETLKEELIAESIRDADGSTPPDGDQLRPTDISRTAKLHGGELLRQGLNVEQVVHGYGDLCQAITELAYSLDITISVNEFRTLNHCLDDAIAGAVTEYSERRDLQLSDQGHDELNQRLGSLAHELRNLIHTATLAVTAMKSGNVGVGGATGAVLDRSLIGMQHLIDRSLAEVRIGAGMLAPRQRLSVADFIAEVRIASTLEAGARSCKFTVAEVDPSLAVEADREMLFSAINNLLQNAFKFTKPYSEVSLMAYAAGERLLIAVKDHCGGLPAGVAESMFRPFSRGEADGSGLGLGLSIARRSIEANDGTLNVRDVPGSGCVFLIDLPLHRFS